MSRYECPAARRAGDCRWPVSNLKRARRAALRVLQPNLGRYLTEQELKTLASSEAWHAFLWACVRGIPIALPWNDILMPEAAAEEGELVYPEGAAAIEELLHTAMPTIESQRPRKVLHGGQSEGVLPDFPGKVPNAPQTQPKRTPTRPTPSRRGKHFV